MAHSTLISSKKVLVFDIESEYGHFRKFNTTTSPLTYSIPTRPAIAGLVGAVLGIEREIWVGKFREGTTPVAEILSKQNADIAIQIINPIQKVNMGFNLLDTEKSAASFFNIKQRTQIEYELLKNPKFRIFISLNDDSLFKDLVHRIQNNSSHFTPYLGLSQFTASITFKEVIDVKLSISDDYQELITAISISNLDTKAELPIKFDYSQGFKYISDTIPIEMLPNREVVEYAEVIIECTGQKMSVKSNQIYEAMPFGNILFL
jgi:CRISPR-associated protein Cas5h